MSDEFIFVFETPFKYIYNLFGDPQSHYFTSPSHGDCGVTVIGTKESFAVSPVLVDDSSESRMGGLEQSSIVKRFNVTRCSWR